MKKSSTYSTYTSKRRVWERKSKENRTVSQRKTHARASRRSRHPATPHQVGVYMHRGMGKKQRPTLRTPPVPLIIGHTARQTNFATSFTHKKPCHTTRSTIAMHVDYRKACESWRRGVSVFCHPNVLLRNEEGACTNRFIRPRTALAEIFPKSPFAVVAPYWLWGNTDQKTANTPMATLAHGTVCCVTISYVWISPFFALTVLCRRRSPE